MYTNPGSGIFLWQSIMVLGLTLSYRFRHLFFTLFRKKEQAERDQGTE